MAALSIVILIAGYIVVLAGGIIFLIAAFKESVLWGLACLFVPFVSLIFLILHWREAKRGFFIQLAGIPLIVLGVVLSGSGSQTAWVLHGFV